MKFTHCGRDIAKQVFQVHGLNEHGVVKGRKTLPRARVLEFFAQLPPCLVAIEACAGAHYWARELTKLGHTVKLMAAQYVAAYRKRSKNDANDAEAICEAVGRPLTGNADRDGNGQLLARLLTDCLYCSDLTPWQPKQTTPQAAPYELHDQQRRSPTNLTWWRSASNPLPSGAQAWSCGILWPSAIPGNPLVCNRSHLAFRSTCSGSSKAQ